MSPIATYVFLDLETTGIPYEENNKTKITEISLVAVKREHVLDTRPGCSPRVQHKLTLCLNPGRMIQPSCTDVTGLCNDLLEHEPMFNKSVFNLVDTFLNVLSKPVCLVAQNGLNFDFPILKNHLEKLSVSFAEELVCADCYHGFYDIMEDIKKSEENTSTTNDSTKPQEANEESLYALENTLPMKAINEITPKHIKKGSIINNLNKSKARRRFPWSDGAKPKSSYKLKDIYERLLNRPALNAHRAENDCIMTLECAVAVGKKFVEWVDLNHVPFTEIKPMTIGKRLGE